MTQGNYTPGPWVQSGDACIVGQGRKDVAYLTRNTMPNPELRANARLIAAAPNMLEALRAALPYVRNDNTASVMRAAIANATGEKP